MRSRWMLIAGISATVFNSQAAGQWTRCGPMGGNIQSIAVIGSLTFVSTNYDLFRTQDLGASWEKCQSAPPGFIGSCGTALYCDVLNDGLYRSLDSAASWQRIFYPNYLGSPTQIFGIGDTLFWATIGELNISTDLGTTWVLLDGYQNQISFNDEIIQAIAKDQRTLLVGTVNGLYRSSDNGLGWKEDAGKLLGSYVTGIMHAKGMWLVGTLGGVFSSIDDGLTWSPPLSGWQSLGTVAMIRSDNALFIVIGSGVMVSYDEGITWANFSTPFTVNGFTEVNAVAMEGHDLILGSRWGIMHQKNPSLPWQDSGPLNISTPLMACDETDIVVGTSDYDSGLFSTTSGTQQWNLKNEGLFYDAGSFYGPYLNFDQIAISGNLFLVKGQNFERPNQNVFCSVDKGIHWIRADSARGLQDAVPLSLGVCNLCAFVGGNTGLYRSCDSGKTYQHADGDLPGRGFMALGTHGGKLYAACNDNYIYSTADNGEHWTQLGSLSDTVSNFAFNQKHLYAATLGNGVYQSDTNGTSWILSSSGMTTSGRHCVAASDSFVIVGTDSGVFISLDQGDSWTRFDGNITHNDIRSVGIAGQYAFVTNGEGEMWQYQFSVNAIIHDENTMPQQNIMIESNYPNPFVQQTTLSFTLTTQRAITMQIVDCLGNIVASPFAGILPAGHNKLLWRSAGLPPGVYTCVLHDGLHVPKYWFTVVK